MRTIVGDGRHLTGTAYRDRSCHWPEASNFPPYKKEGQLQIQTCFTMQSLVSCYTEEYRRNADHVCHRFSQESSMSGAQSPPVPARKNQLRAEGRQYTCNLEAVYFFSHLRIITELQRVAKMVGKSTMCTPLPISSCTNCSGTLYRQDFQQIFTAFWGFVFVILVVFIICNLYSHPDSQPSECKPITPFVVPCYVCKIISLFLSKL